MIDELSSTLSLTPTQQAMLIYSLYAPASRAYFEQVCYAYDGPLDVAAFRKAWQQVVARHDILRSSFFSSEGDQPGRSVLAEVELPFQYLDWRNLSRIDRRQSLERFLQSDGERGFNLARPPLIRVAVLQFGDEEFRIVVSNHHIILDGWSMSLLRREVSQSYTRLVHGRGDDLPLAPQFDEYVQWLEKQDTSSAADFWRRQLEGFVAPNRLAIDVKTNDAPRAGELFAETTVSLPVELTKAIKASARSRHVTISTMLQGAWAILLSRYCASDDVLFGMTISGRPYDLPQVESQVGLLINTLPVRVQFSEDESISDFLKRIQDGVTGALEFGYCSLKQIQQWSSVPLNFPLFETLVVFENFAGANSLFELAGEIRVCSSQLSRTNYPLTLVINPDQQLRLQVVYHANRFHEADMERLLAHLAKILEAISADANAMVHSVPMLTARETRLLDSFNNSATEFPTGIAVTQLFERQAQATPEAVALVSEDQTMTYAELEARANKLARHLKALGVGAESLVGICLPRSPAMVTAVLGVLKAGGAYVPLDPTYPEGRLAFMLSDSGVEVAITLAQFAPRLGTHCPLFCLDTDAGPLDSYAATNLNDSAEPGDAAYVIYTSGSTGEPKGTVIEHRSLSNFTQAAVDAYQITAADRVLQFASLNFDTSVEEIFPILVQGGTLVLRTEAMLSSAKHFLEACAQFGITVLDLPTAYWHQLTDELVTDNLSVPDSLRLVILGGEKALPERLARWRTRVGNHVKLVNTYGPTETTVVATISNLSDQIEDSEAPIGRPVANTFAYVLDRRQQRMPVGFPGELYLGGAGVARGYLHQPELTKEKFLANPFAEQRAPRLYRTGDVVRYRPDGQLEFLGRIDNQIKIRGFRVELEEIEAALRTYKYVNDAVVLTEEQAGDKRLIAYVVAGKDISVNELRRFLSDQLPAYMVPAVFTFVAEIPLLPNGKTDRRALKDIASWAETVSAEVAAPRSPLEESVAEVWATVLKVERPSIHDNFFELGGHSLLAAKLISNLRRQMNVELSLIDIFQAPTIAKLSNTIYERQTTNEADDELEALLAELENMSDEEAERRVSQEIRKGGSRAHALRMALLTTGGYALQILAETL